MRMTSRTGSARRILGFWKSQLVELSPASGEDSWLSLAHGGLGQVSHVMGGGIWKSQNTKNVYLSPYVEEPLNSKVIKSFVPELRSRKCFSCFKIPCSMLYIYEHYLSFSHIAVSGYGTNSLFYSIKYAYLTLIIFKQSYLTHRWDPSKY